MANTAHDILQQSIVIDCLFHGLFEDVPVEADDKINIFDLLHNGGVTAISDTMLDDNYPSNLAAAVKTMYNYYLLEDTLPDQVVIVRSSKDIVRAKETGKLAVIMSSQGADVFEHDLRYISALYRMNLKIVQLTYNHQGNLGSGVYEPHDGGLTRFGQQCIYEMNRVGMLIDLSHVGYQTTMDAMEITRDPVIFSHSSAKALCKHRRNITDEQIAACGKTGGVICACPHSVMMNDDQSTWPTVDRFIDHILHIAGIAGIDAVGVGTDRWRRETLRSKMGRVGFDRTLPGWFGAFNDVQKQVEGFNYFDKWESFVEAMLKRRFSEEEIKKVLGGNLMRVFEQVWDKGIR